MGEKTGWLRNNGFVISLLFFSPALYAVLFFARSVDDNRTTSWQDVFTVADPVTVLVLVIICSAAGLVLSKLSLSERYPSFFLFVSSFAISAIFWSEPEVIVDASRYFAQAKYLELYGAGFFVREWGRTIFTWTDLPVVPFFYGLIFRIFGENRLFIQIFTTLLFSLSTVLVYWTGKKLFDADSGFYAGVLFLGIPYLYSQVPLMLVDVPSMFFLLLALYSFIHALEKGTALRIAFSAIAITLAFYSKYSMWMMLSVLIVISFAFRNALPGMKTSDYRARVSAIFLASALLSGAVFIYKFDSLSEQIGLLLSYQKPGLRRWGESFVSTFFFQVHPVITFAAIYSAYAAWKKKDVRYLCVLWLVFLVIFFQIRRIRYIIMVFPMLALMASYGLQRIRQREIIRAIAFSVAAYSFAVGVFAYLPFLQKNSAANFMNAGKYLDALEIRGAEVFTAAPENSHVNPAVSVPILDLFTRKQIVYTYDLKTPVSAGKIEKSPLRFTWEYKNPPYYEMSEKTKKSSAAVVIVSDGPPGELSPEIRQMIAELNETETFDIRDEIYEYQPVVTVHYRSDDEH
ncbi:MAG: glycosyltransferase family 39 protein [Nitrospirota bacterium]|nr:glycosyltransferase family 39 protein [Nitrospirota bacterium]